MRRLWTILLFLCLAINTLIAQGTADLRLNAYGLLWAKDYTGATEAFDLLIAQSGGTQPDYYYQRGKSLFLREEYTRSLSDLQQAASLGSIEAWLWIARNHAMNHDGVNALAALERYLKLTTFPDINSLKKDTCFRDLHNNEVWFLLWQRDWNTPEMDLISEADYFRNQKNFTRAHAIIEENLKPDKDDSRLYAYNAFLYSAEENPELALNEINHALAIDPADVNFLKQKSEYLIKLGNYQDACTLLSHLLTIVPEDFNARILRADLGLRINQLALAKEDIELILRYNQDDDKVFLAGQIYYALGNYVDALKLYNRLLAKDSSNAAYFKARGMTYYNTRTYRQAGYDLSMSLDLEPDDPEVNYYKGLTENALGNKQMACYYMHRALKDGSVPASEYITKNCAR